MARALLLNELRRRSAQFAIECRDAVAGERQEVQSCIRDLVQVYGITKSKAALYEYRARRTPIGTLGYLDTLVPGRGLIEMKSAGNELAPAEKQFPDCIDDLTKFEAPRMASKSDFRHFRLPGLNAEYSQQPSVHPKRSSLN